MASTPERITCPSTCSCSTPSTSTTFMQRSRYCGSMYRSHRSPGSITWESQSMTVTAPSSSRRSDGRVRADVEALGQPALLPHHLALHVVLPVGRTTAGLGHG